jgi:dipeptidyl aminopeptidase/acylaminoacyl peptidase
MRISAPFLTSFVFFWGLMLIFGGWKKNEPPEIRYVEEYIALTQVAKLPLLKLPKGEAWQQKAPEVVEISIPRRSGEPDQPALWYHSGSDRKKPLLLVLHSWSEDYRQHYGIPYAAFAEKNDWIFIHPNFRGRFNNEDATGSEKTVQDILEALDYAMAKAPVDEGRIYLAGFSGGAMMSLNLVGRYPEKFTAALAWVPVYDLNDWHGDVVRSPHSYTAHYQADIESSCGGRPDADPGVREECAKRSPSAYLANARGKAVKVFISGGLRDHFVPPSHAIRAFNDLAGEDDRISQEDQRFIDENKALPERLKGQGEKNFFFEEAGLPVAFSRTSENATLFLFDGGHDLVYNAGFSWLAQQSR